VRVIKKSLISSHDKKLNSFLLILLMMMMRRRRIHNFKSNIMKMNSNDDYFNEEEGSNIEICLFCSCHCSQGKPNGSINGLLGLIMSRNYNMMICLQEYIE
jgi:hypothetical protein